MGKNKNFNVEETVKKIGYLFLQNGYNGTSIGDIVKETGLLRGSLYGTFGSKEGMFIAALNVGLENDESELMWGLILVAMLEVTPRSTKVKSIIQKWYKNQNYKNIEEKIGAEIIKHSKLSGLDHD